MATIYIRLSNSGGVLDERAVDTNAEDGSTQQSLAINEVMTAWFEDGLLLAPGDTISISPLEDASDIT